MGKGDAFWRNEASKDNLEKAEKEGRVADGMDVRMSLVRRFESGEISFEQMQTELAQIKRDAKKSGKVTRAQAWRGH